MSRWGKSLRRYLLFWEVERAAAEVEYSLQIFILQRIYRIFLTDLPHRINHRGKYDQEHAPYSNYNAIPGNKEVLVYPIRYRAVNQPGDANGHGYAIEQPLYACSMA